MLHEDEGHPRIRSQTLEQLRDGLEPARRRADAHDGKAMTGPHCDAREIRA